MPEPRTCHLLHRMALFCNGAERLDRIEALGSHYSNIVISDIGKLGGRR